MNYKLHYNKLILKAKNRILDEYKEMHHIIPRCLGGTDAKDNLIALTAREHFIAHLLLLKIYPHQYSLIKAVNMMCVQGTTHHRSMNRMYGWLREKFAKEMSRSQTGEKNSQFGRVWIHNVVLRESRTILKNEQIPLGWELGRVINFDLYYETQERKKQQELKIKQKEQKKADILSKKIQKELDAEQYKKYILELYTQFKHGNYYSVSHFHKSNNIKVSRMTLTNYWKKWIPEYNKNSKEGKRFRF